MGQRHPEPFYENQKNTKGLIFLFLFRLSSFFCKNLFLKIIGFPIRFLYRVFIQWVLGIDIPDSTKIGRGFNVQHGQGLIINSNTIIKNFVTVRQNTTIGNSNSGGKCPTIEDFVNVGANVVIVGDIIIGKHSIIGAGSVVVKSIPPYSIAVGNPARVVKHLKSEHYA